MLNDISSLTILALISVPMPGIAQIVMGFILSQGQFDVLPSETIYEWFFTFDDDNDQALNPYFEQVGYETTNSLRNMGSYLIYLIIKVAILPLLWLILYFRYLKKLIHILYRVKYLFRFVTEMIIWNYYLRFMHQ